MGSRIHTTRPNLLAVNYVQDPAQYFEDDEMAVGPGLVLDDDGNMEALVIVGSPSDLGDFARRILSSLPTALTEAEQSYLTSICEDYGYDAETGAVGRSASGWAYFISEEDATGFDLTNQQMREVTYDD